MPARVVVLGAGFGGLELSAALSEALGDRIDVTLIDRDDAFVFGFSKLEVMFGRAAAEAVRLSYGDVSLPGVRFRRERVTAIDPESRRVRTEAGEHAADFLVIALGADYDKDATPGLAEGGNDFYSLAGAQRLAELIPEFSEGHALVGVCGAPYKCTPAPSECALLLHDELTARGVRGSCRISLVTPLGAPVPPSPDASAAILEAFGERGIDFLPGNGVASIEPARGVALLQDGGELSFDLFLGVPRHRAPQVVLDAGVTEDGYVPVDQATLETSHPGVYAVGDVTSAAAPKAGTFAEGQARVVAQRLIAEIGGGQPPAPYDGRGACYIEFGQGNVARVDVEVVPGRGPVGTFTAPSAALAAEKEQFAASRRARWLG